MVHAEVVFLSATDPCSVPSMAELCCVLVRCDTTWHITCSSKVKADI